MLLFLKILKTDCLVNNTDIINVILGSRYLSWLPSFSVEVTHSLRSATQLHTSQLETMARQVRFLNHSIIIYSKCCVHKYLYAEFVH